MDEITFALEIQFGMCRQLLTSTLGAPLNNMEIVYATNVFTEFQKKKKKKTNGTEKILIIE